MPAQELWKPWNVQLVADADGPALALRTYLEQADVRGHLERVAAEGPIESACEIGCGYGRMIVVLGEFAGQVVGFEREPGFVEAARRLHPRFSFHQVAGLGLLPVRDGCFDLVLSFTVLQHVTDQALGPALAEIKRVLGPSGWVLLCEETKPATRQGDVTDEGGVCMIGRSVSTYAELMAPLRLAATSPRRVEPTYPHQDVGTYMLFRK